MRRTCFFLLAAALGCAAVLGLPRRAEAQRMARSVRRPFPPGRMPGWDWWRIYPYSPYNYYNPSNPYSPYYGRWPYPYPPPYPDYGAPSVPDVPGVPPVPGVPSVTHQQVLVPQPTGELRSPPPGAAVIEVRVPDAFAQVSFDDHRTYSVGRMRYYVTPELPVGRDLSYQVTAVFARDGQNTTERRSVTVAPGEVKLVDFTRPAPARPALGRRPPE